MDKVYSNAFKGRSPSNALLYELSKCRYFDLILIQNNIVLLLGFISWVVRKVGAGIMRWGSPFTLELFQIDYILRSYWNWSVSIWFWLKSENRHFRTHKRNSHFAKEISALQLYAHIQPNPNIFISAWRSHFALFEKC